MKLEQVLFYCKDNKAIKSKPIIQDLFRNKIKIIFLNYNEISFIQDSPCVKNSILITDLPDGNQVALSLGIPFIGVYNFGIPYSYPDAVSLFETIDSLTFRYIEGQWCRGNNLPITIAQTKRITIRELTDNHIPDLYRLYQKAENTQFIPTLSTSLEDEMEKHKQYVKYQYEFFGYGLWGIFNSEKVLIGHAGIQNVDFSQFISSDDTFPNEANWIELSYLMDKNFRKRGYAREAVFQIYKYVSEELDINTLYCFITKNNLSSIKLAMDMGMQKISECRYHGFPCNLYQIKHIKEWLPKYREEMRLCASTNKAWDSAQLKPIQTVYKRVYTKTRKKNHSE